MINISESLRLALSGSKRKELRLTADGAELDAYTVTYTASACAGDAISIGDVCAAMVKAKVAGKLALANKALTVEVGAEVDGQTEWLSLGRFVVSTSQAGDDTTEITAYDAAYYALGGEYEPRSGSLTALTVLADICRKCGITPAFVMDAFIVGQAVVGKTPLGTGSLHDVPVTGDLTGHTCREMVGHMAALLGCNAVIDREGRLALRWFVHSGLTLTPDDYYSGGLSLDGESTLAGLRMTKTVKIRTEGEDGTTAEEEITEVYDAGSGSGTVIAVENPYATQEIVNGIWERIKGLGTYRTGSCSAFGGLLIEPGDLIEVTDLLGETSTVPVMTVVLELDGGCKCTLSAAGQSETETAAGVHGPMREQVERIKADIAEFRRLYVQNLEAELARINNLYADQAWVEKLFGQYIEAVNLHVSGESTVAGFVLGDRALRSLDGPAALDDTETDGVYMGTDGVLSVGSGNQGTGTGKTSVRMFDGKLYGIVKDLVDQCTYHWMLGYYSQALAFMREGADGWKEDMSYYGADYCNVAGNLDVDGALTAGGMRVPQVQRGSVLITPSAANTPTGKAVTFDESFSAAPTVTATARSVVPGTQVTGVGVTGESTTGVTVYLTRTNTNQTSVGWIAVN